MKWRVAFLSLIAAAVWTGQPAAAHPADQHQLFHSIALSPDGVRVTWSIVVAPLLAPGLWQQADTNGDGLVSQGEADAWALPNVPLLIGRIDESAALAWRLDGVTWPASFDAMQAGDEAIEIRLSAPWPATLAAENSLTLANSFDSKHAASWFVLEPSAEFDIVDAVADQATRFVVHFRPHAAAGGLHQGSTPEPPAETDSPALPATRSATLQRLTELLQTRSTSPAFYGLALAVALALGALHALTPGHGKTVVAAYLVGSRGTSLHAVSLGAVTTLTHTGSVLLLGLIALAASRTIVPNDLYPLLNVVSGALIVLLGANLLYRRWVEYKQGSPHHPHGHDHVHSHDHDHVYEDGQPAAGHDHGHVHAHSHAEPALPGRVTWRSLLVLGVSGGLVPCPDAIAILLLAIAIQRLGLGLALIVSFSLGLAIVLIAIGLAMLHSRRLFARLSAFDRVSPVLPMVSAAIVLVLGIALTARAL